MFEHDYTENSAVIGTVSIDKDGSYNFTKEVVEAVLMYIYVGKLPPNINTLVPDVFVLAHMWLLDGLQELCMEKMVKDVGVSNFQQLLGFAGKYDIPKLQAVVKGFIPRSLPIIYKSSEFINMKEEDMAEMLNEPFTYCHENLIWLNALKFWSQDSGEKFKNVLKNVRLDFLTKE